MMGQYQQVDIPIKAWIIQNKEEADQILLHGGKIILLTEDVPDYLSSPQYGSSCLMANCLLPSYEAVSYYLDNDFQTFSNVYNEILGLPESTIYFVTIISAMLNDIPLGFVFGVEEIEQAATTNFLNYLAVMYGIHLGVNSPYGQFPSVIGQMDRAFVPRNMSLLYMNNLLTPQEFLYVYPIDAKIDINILQKLVFDLRPPLSDPMNMLEVESYFEHYRAGVRKANRVLVDPLVMI